MNWPTIWRILFGYEPDAIEVTDLESWLDREFPPHGTDKGWMPSELVSALDAYAEKARGKGERCKGPTGPQIKTLIIRARYELKRQNEPPQAPCAACHGGWVTVYPCLTDEPTLEQTHAAYCLAAPCVCPAGERLWKTCSYYKDIGIEQQDRVKALGRKGVRQQANIVQGLRTIDRAMT